ncbi:MAG: DUF2239 family protein [Fibrobacteria bacterium]
MQKANTYAAFDGGKLVARGTLPEVALRVKRRLGKAEHGSVQIFSDDTGNAMDFNFHGSEKEVLKRLEVFTGAAGPEVPDSAGPGRPRLGVVSREVSLLPRQWEWLASQSGGASAVLRRLIDEAKRKTSEGHTLKQFQERTYKFMSAIGGDLEGYEEAIRALYKNDRKGFLLRTAAWPQDIREHALDLAGPVFEGGTK